MLASASFLHSPNRLLRWLPIESITEIRSSPALSTELDGPILYWLSASARCESNYALESAVEIARACNREVAIVFFIDPRYPNANERSFRFLLEGLLEANLGLKRRGLKLCVKYCRRDLDIPSLVIQYLQRCRVPCLILDCGYSRVARLWRDQVKRNSNPRMNIILIEDLVLVPTKLVSTTPVDSAKELRERQKPHLDRFANIECPTVSENECKLYTDPHENDKDSNYWPLEEVEDIDKILDCISTCVGKESFHYVPASTGFKGGCIEAKKHLATFMRDHLCSYKTLRNKPECRCQSKLSSYLHYGQINVAYIVRNVKRHKSASWEDKYKFLDAVVCRREVAINHVLHEPDHDNFDCLPTWAKTSMTDQHRSIEKKLLSREHLERALTPDALWNAAQQELVFMGKMHGYLRMYWCKQILRWQAPKEAVETAVWLNDKYSLDGRDPNGHFGVMWCFGKQDHPFSPSRPVFGTLRPMTLSGVRSKFDTNKYVNFIKKECARLSQIYPILADRGPKEDIRQSLFFGTINGRSNNINTDAHGSADDDEGNDYDESKKRPFEVIEVKGNNSSSGDFKKVKASKPITEFFQFKNPN